MRTPFGSVSRSVMLTIVSSSSSSSSMIEFVEKAMRYVLPSTSKVFSPLTGLAAIVRHLASDLERRGRNHFVLVRSLKLVSRDDGVERQDRCRRVRLGDAELCGLVAVEGRAHQLVTEAARNIVHFDADLAGVLEPWNELAPAFLA